LKTFIHEGVKFSLIESVKIQGMLATIYFRNVCLPPAVRKHD